MTSIKSSIRLSIRRVTTLARAAAAARQRVAELSEQRVDVDVDDAGGDGWTPPRFQAPRRRR
jgi:hypothetical protein